MNKKQRNFQLTGAIFHFIATILLTVALIVILIIALIGTGSSTSGHSYYSTNAKNYISYDYYASIDDFLINDTVYIEKDGIQYYYGLSSVEEKKGNLVFCSNRYGTCIIQIVSGLVINTEGRYDQNLVIDDSMWHFYTISILDDYGIVLNYSKKNYQVVSSSGGEMGHGVTELQVQENNFSSSTYSVLLNAEMIVDIDYDNQQIIVDEEEFCDYNSIPLYLETDYYATISDFTVGYSLYLNLDNGQQIKFGDISAKNDYLIFLDVEQNGTTFPCVLNLLDTVSIIKDTSSKAIYLLEENITAQNFLPLTPSSLEMANTNIEVYCGLTTYYVVDYNTDGLIVANDPIDYTQTYELPFTATILQSIVTDYEMTNVVIYVNEANFCRYNGLPYEGSGGDIIGGVLDIAIFIPIILLIALLVANMVISGLMLRNPEKRNKKTTYKSLRITAMVFCGVFSIVSLAFFIFACIDGVLIALVGIGLLFVLLVISFIMYSLSFVRFKTNFEKFIEQDRGFKNLPIISRLKQQGIFDEWEAQELIYRQVLRN